MKQTEAQKRASANYHKKHIAYYNEKSKLYGQKIRDERKEYKQRIDEAIEYGTILMLGESTFEERQIASTFIKILRGDNND